MKAAMQAAHEDKFASMARQMGRWMDHVLGPGFHKYRPDESWSPAINLYEDEAHYCLVVDLAGVKAEEIDLRAEARKLTISGFRQAPGVKQEVTGDLRLHHMEIDHGQFSRSMELPKDVDSDRIKACYKHGFLWIELPKRS